MANGLCGANCAECQLKEHCSGCEATCGSPFGGRCVAAECVKAKGKEAYAAFKGALLEEVNALLRANGWPQAGALYELAGSFTNLAYPMPNGEAVKLLEDKNVYLGAQIETQEAGKCLGVIAGEDFVIVCRYGVNASDPELLLYKKR